MQNNLKSFHIENIINSKKEALKNLSIRQEAVSIDSVLKRGFAWVTDSHFNTVYDTNSAKKIGDLRIRFYDGIVKTKVMEKNNAVQGDLFDNL